MIREPNRDFRLLVADDDSGFRETVRGILEPHFETIGVGSGEEAIQVVEHRSVDLVLMDVQMHILDGVEAVRIVKTIRAELPCILITANLTEQLKQRARLARAYTVLQKPPSRGYLLQTIQAALRDSYGNAAG